MGNRFTVYAYYYGFAYRSEACLRLTDRIHLMR